MEYKNVKKEHTSARNRLKQLTKRKKRDENEEKIVRDSIEDLEQRGNRLATMKDEPLKLCDPAKKRLEAKKKELKKG